MANSNPYAEDLEGSHNPFQAPENPLDPDALHNTSAEAIRHKHLSHEASVKSVGALYLLGGLVAILASLALAYYSLATAPRDEAVNFVVAVVVFVFGLLQCGLAMGLNRLRSWARIPAVIISAIGLIGFPIGTLVNGYILYLLCSTKGAMVFSVEYQEIMAQTPHIKYRTSIVVWIFVALLVALLLLSFGVAFMG